MKNTLNAILVCKALNLTDEQIRNALANMQLTDMRMQLINGKNDVLFINDAYNAAPTSVKAAIEFVSSTTMRSDKWLVLGDMLELGENEQAFHEQLAESIDPAIISRVCLFGPRMKALFNKLTLKFDATKLIYSETDYASIIETIEKNATAESLILVKGSRGMKLETIINTLK